MWELAEWYFITKPNSPCLMDLEKGCYGRPATCQGNYELLGCSTPCVHCHYFTDDLKKNNGRVGMARLTQEVGLECWLVKTKSYAPVRTLLQLPKVLGSLPIPPLPI